MDEIKELRQRMALTQEELAAAAGTSQPAIAAYEAGRRSPTLRTVRRLARAMGMDAVVEFYPPLTREDRRSLALHRAIAQRLAEDPEGVLRQARANLDRMARRHRGATQLLREWEVLLDRSIDHLIPLLTDPSPRARELRQVTPFAGVLSSEERTRAYRAFTASEAGRN